MNKIEVEVKDLYQLLIAECRYGYSRNNHLMPGGAYDHVKAYLPVMDGTDEEMAMNTAKQLCEECISMQLSQFDDGIDDENGNRKEAFEFIKYLLEFVNSHYKASCGGWKPYNYDQYLRNKAKDDEPRYRIAKVEYTSITDDDYKEDSIDAATIGKIYDITLCKNNVLNYLFKDILKVKDNETIIYRKYKTKANVVKVVFDDRKEAYMIIGGDC